MSTRTDVIVTDEEVYSSELDSTNVPAWRCNLINDGGLLTSVEQKERGEGVVVNAMCSAYPGSAPL